MPGVAAHHAQELGRPLIGKPVVAMHPGVLNLGQPQGLRLLRAKAFGFPCCFSGDMRCAATLWFPWLLCAGLPCCCAAWLLCAGWLPDVWVL